MFVKYAKKRRAKEALFEFTPRFLDQLRPCEVDGKFCWFHRFIEEDRALLSLNCYHPEDVLARLTRIFNEEGVVRPGCSTEIIRETFALVEYPDGSVGKVKPELVQFLDRKEG